MKRDTIIYIGGFELPDGNAAAHRVVANAKIMRDLGYRVILVGVRKENSGRLTRYQEDYEGFESWSVPKPAGYFRWLDYITGLKSLLGLLDATGRRLEAVICYNYPAVAQWRIFRRSWSLGGLGFADATEWYDASGGNIIYRAVKAIDTWLRMNLVNRSSDGVITISAWMTNYYKKKRKPIIELPPLFDTIEHVSGLGHSSKGGARSFIYVGNPFDASRVNSRRTNLKDRLDICIDLFHEASRKGWDFSFNVYGVTQQEYLSVFPEHAVKLRDLDKKISFHGRVPNSEIRNIVAASDFSIFFRDESRVTLAGFPTKLVESISLGTPVISSLHQSVARYADSPWLYLAKPGEEMAGVLWAMSLSDDQIEELKLNCLAAKVFDYRSYTERFSGFLHYFGRS